ncbi:MAG: GNAT family N-acetyltransferase [Pseudonocardia sp.]|nr:GNAT family N-acetyltransferase [Pseudonocardia sp.]
MLIHLLDDPSFALSIATLDEEPVGFAYGVTLAEDTSAEPPGHTFHVMDLAVSHAHRRRGLGRRLLAMLLDGRSERRATLTVQPTATETQTFYRCLGWQHAGTRESPDNTISPTWEVYVLPLR